ncbi:hypothetical protein CYMTET_11879 [Cymbomonas tetramitiformis]|uniref:Cyclic nucleotide-binding domain-containing protein n=1 Tax=Cymbomonas tetramitiformis TaxID=36881 RepID=A0AAE0GMU4_9CHLO|nr:hypothetical protein CYMTET_11879 [Cymbomonas tetramitiformis]
MVHAGLAASAVAATSNDAIVLRTFYLMANIILVVYYLFSFPRIMWAQVSWYMFFVVTHSTKLSKLIAENRPVQLDYHQQQLFNRVFDQQGLTQPQFLRLWEAGEYKWSSAGTVLLEPDHEGRLLLLSSGSAAVEIQNMRVGELTAGNFIGEEELLFTNPQQHRWDATPNSTSGPVIRCLTDTQYMMWKVHRLNKMLKQNPAIRAILVMAIAQNDMAKAAKHAQVSADRNKALRDTITDVNAATDMFKVALENLKGMLLDEGGEATPLAAPPPKLVQTASVQIQEEPIETDAQATAEQKQGSALPETPQAQSENEPPEHRDKPKAGEEYSNVELWESLEGSLKATTASASASASATAAAVAGQLSNIISEGFRESGLSGKGASDDSIEPISEEVLVTEPTEGQKDAAEDAVSTEVLESSDSEGIASSELSEAAESSELQGRDESEAIIASDQLAATVFETSTVNQILGEEDGGALAWDQMHTIHHSDASISTSRPIETEDSSVASSVLKNAWLSEGKNEAADEDALLDLPKATDYIAGGEGDVQDAQHTYMATSSERDI